MRSKVLMLAIVLALGSGCHSMGCGCCIDGGFWVQGLAVDRNGQPVPNVTVKTQNTSVVTDKDGCFQIYELTYPYKHEMPFSVTAAGFKPYVKAVVTDSAAKKRFRVSLAETTSATSTVLDMSPAPDSLGPCEITRPGQGSGQ